MIGGAQEEGDRGPRETLEREIGEEFELTDEGIWAPREFIHNLRDEVIQHTTHYKDFLSVCRQSSGAPKDYTSIDSAYLAAIPSKLFGEVEGQLKAGCRIVNEGNLAIVTLDELMEGIPLTAWSTGEIIGSIFEAELPNPEDVVSIPLEASVRRKHSDYREMFLYSSD